MPGRGFLLVESKGLFAEKTASTLSGEYRYLLGGFRSSECPRDKTRMNALKNGLSGFQNTTDRKQQRSAAVLSYRIVTVLSVTGFFLLGMLPSDASAQARVAVVDVGLVFKSHPTFSQELEALKGQADGFKEETMQLQNRLKQKAIEIQGAYGKETDEFRSAETELAQEVAALEIKQKNKLRGLMEKEAQLHYQTYQQIKQAIETYSQQRQINLVLRHSGNEVDQKNPASIMQRVNGKVVFYRAENEITSQIIGMLTR